MTGYNHYPDCACGWCVNYGRTRINRAEIRTSLRVHDAEIFLKKNGARSIAGCYVNPNARCPVCKEPVFFYANEFGSRVYFDDLGPPWPKHPCTDNPKQRIKEHPPFSGPPTRRARGMTQEIIEAARIAGSLRSPVPNGGRWDLLVIVSAKRHGTKNLVVAQLLASDDVEQVAFTCHSEEPIFEVDDFVSKRADIYSFFDKKTLSALTFKEGGWVHKSEEAPPRPAPPPEPPLPARRPSPRLATAATPTPATKPARTYDMTRQEMAHFHSKKKSVQQLCEELLPVVRAYAREGDRKPRDVAARLNREGRRTLLGSRWTPRLAYFLLGLVFMPAKSTTTDKDSVRSDDPKEKPAPSGPMTSEEVARRLSKLGRVVLSGSE